MNAEPKDTIAAILGASAALAGLLLVFVGFVYARAEGYKTRRGDKFRYIAKAGVIPFAAALVCTWVSMRWMTGNAWLYSWSVGLFEASLGLTLAYGALTLIFFL